VVIKREKMQFGVAKELGIPFAGEEKLI